MSTSEKWLPEFDQETASTRRILERCPAEKFSWAPHPKSMSLGKLATHLAGMPDWGVMTIDTDELNMEPGQFKEDIPSTTADLLARFEASTSKFREKLTAVSDDALAQSWTFKFGGHQVFSAPRSEVIRSSVFNHTIHHRAQLTVYLRLLDIPVPGLYGPSADESM